MPKAAPDFAFIKAWRDEMRGKIKLVFPTKSDEEIDKYLNKKIDDRFKDHDCVVHNNHQDKSAKSSLLQLIEFIHDTKPIIGGQGVLYKNQYQSANPSAGMLEDVMNRRDIIKKERKKCAEGSYEWLMKDIGQDNMKRVANSFYGANGAPTSTFYNLYTAASVTGTGQALMSIHNIKFLIDFSQKARQAILEDRFEEFYNKHYPMFVN